MARQLRVHELSRCGYHLETTLRTHKRSDEGVLAGEWNTNPLPTTCCCDPLPLPDRCERWKSGGADSCIWPATRLLPGRFPLDLSRARTCRSWQCFYLRPSSSRRSEPTRSGRDCRRRASVEGAHYVVELRFADGQRDRLPGLARELQLLRPAVFVVGGSLLAALELQPRPPMVFTAIALDPVEWGIVKATPGRAE